MYWIGLYDCIMLVLMGVHVWQPSNRFTHPAVLVAGCILKEFVLNRPLVITRLLVLFVSIAQVYVVLPLARFWERWCPCPRSRRSQQRSSMPEISCLHDEEKHHISTSGGLCCRQSCTYRLRYTWREQMFSMLLPTTTTPTVMLADCIGRMRSCSHKTMRPPLVVVRVKYHGLDLTRAIVEVLGPERDGHATLSEKRSLQIRPLHFLVWLSTFYAQANDTQSEDIGLSAHDDEEEDTMVYDLDVEYRNGSVRTVHTNEHSFTVADLVTMCTTTTTPTVE